jgi:hypothetical protein
MHAHSVARTLAAASLAAAFAGCAGGSRLTPAGTAAQGALHASSSSAAGMQPGQKMGSFASDLLNRRAAAARSLRTAGTGTFAALRPQPALEPGKPLPSWEIVSDEGGGDLYVVDDTGYAVASCTGCAGWGVAVNKKNNDLAVGTQNGTVTVYHRNAQTYFTQYATLNLGSDNEPIGLAYDAKGGLYVSDLASNEIQYFTAQTIANGGGSANETLYPPDFYQVYFLACDGDTLIADGVTGAPRIIVATVKNTKKGATDDVVQAWDYGTVFPGGIAVDKNHNLIFDNQFGTISIFKKPWDFPATTTWNWGLSDSGYIDYTDLALSKDQTWIYFANDLDFGYFADIVTSYYSPLGWYGSSQNFTPGELIGIAVDPAAP